MFAMLVKEGSDKYSLLGYRDELQLSGNAWNK